MEKGRKLLGIVFELVLGHTLKCVMNTVRIDIVDHDMMAEGRALIWNGGRVGIGKVYSLRHLVDLLLVDPYGVRGFRFPFGNPIKKAHAHVATRKLNVIYLGARIVGDRSYEG